MGLCQADQDDVLDNQLLTHTVGPSSGHPLFLSQQFMQKKKLTLVGRDKKVAYCPIRIHSGDPFAEIVEVGGGHGSPVAKDARSSCPAGVRAPVSHQSL
jgi:hypothetical protein